MTAILNATGLSFMKAVRFFDPQQAKTMIFADNFTESLPGYDKKHAHDEIAPYKLAANKLAPDITGIIMCRFFYFDQCQHKIIYNIITN